MDIYFLTTVRTECQQIMYVKFNSAATYNPKRLVHTSCWAKTHLDRQCILMVLNTFPGEQNQDEIPNALLESAVLWKCISPELVVESEIRILQNYFLASDYTCATALFPACTDSIWARTSDSVPRPTISSPTRTRAKRSLSPCLQSATSNQHSGKFGFHSHEVFRM